MHDLAGQQIASLDVLLRAAGVATLAVGAVPAAERGQVLEALAAHVSLVDGEHPAADAAVVLAVGKTDGTHAALDAATSSQTPGLVIVVAAHQQDQADVDEWATRNASWLTLTRPPQGYAVLAPLGTLLEFPDLPGVWRGGADDRPPVPVVQSSRSERTNDIDERARANAIAAWELRGQLNRQIAETDAQRLAADRLRARLVSERVWAAAEADRVRASSSWRLGHRLVRTARLLTFRRDKGTDGLSRLAERMRAPVDE
ncbi:MAG: hypothetical protein JWO02_3983 [Solirubrobacterales bacterium]|nr:hypothetical protein [Solirubrobacterales bacterium]